MAVETGNPLAFQNHQDTQLPSQGFDDAPQPPAQPSPDNGNDANHLDSIFKYLVPRQPLFP